MPTFDGPEDRNGRRNHDEIRFRVDYVTPGKSSYIVDDEGNKRGLRPSGPFVIVVLASSVVPAPTSAADSKAIDVVG